MAQKFIKKNQGRNSKWKMEIEYQFFNCANISAPLLLHKHSRISLKFVIANLGKLLQFI